MPRSRITVRLPDDLLRALDARAVAEGRPRSAVVADAIRAYLTPTPPPSVGALDDARRQQLLADLALTPAERVRRSEAMAAAEDAKRPRDRRKYVIQFESIKDYFDWKDARRLGG